MRLWAKLEDRNPTGSIKDRPALAMIEAAEAEGRLRAGLHRAGADLGQHRHRAGHGRQAQGLPAGLRDAGEHLDRAPAAAAGLRRGDHLSPPAAGGSNQAVAMAKKLAERNPDWVMLYQYGNPANAGRALPGHRPGDPA